MLFCLQSEKLAYILCYIIYIQLLNCWLKKITNRDSGIKVNNVNSIKTLSPTPKPDVTWPLSQHNILPLAWWVAGGAWILPFSNYNTSCQYLSLFYFTCTSWTGLKTRMVTGDGWDREPTNCHRSLEHQLFKCSHYATKTSKCVAFWEEAEVKL